MIGRFIVFEGVEGCGKTTQLNTLNEWLPQSVVLQRWHQYVAPNHPNVIITREPGGTDLGQMLRGILLGQNQYQTRSEIDYRTELLLYAADRAQHVHEALMPQLQNGAIVLCDRYIDSTIAYQGYGRGLDRKLIDQLNAIATGGLQSDLTLWLDLDVEEGLARTQKRGEADRMEKSTLDFHHRVQQGFRELAIAHPDRIVRIDAQGSPQHIAQRIQTIVEERFHQWIATARETTP